MRSKPDPVDQPERTAHYDCAILCNRATCIAEMLHNTKHRDSSVNIPLSQTNITVQMRPSGG